MKQFNRSSESALIGAARKTSFINWRKRNYIRMYYLSRWAPYGDYGYRRRLCCFFVFAVIKIRFMHVKPVIRLQC